MKNEVGVKISRKAFEVLTVLEERKCSVSQRELAETLNYGLGTINKVLKELVDNQMVSNGAITLKGISALEPFRVKRAIIVAAGFGSRMVPITLNTPKPLVRVHGKRIIEGILDAVIEAGIEEIYIVRGYLAEQFDQLLLKYPMIKFVDNPLYNEANNISSAMCVRHLIQNAYVLEADLLLHNKSLIKKYQYASNFLGIPVTRTDDWCFVTKNGIIKSQQVGGEVVSKNGNTSTELYQEVGISYWSEEDGKKLESHIRQVYDMPGGKECYWDQVPLRYFNNEYQIEIRKCDFEDIVEIDTFRELKLIDPIYDVK